VSVLEAADAARDLQRDVPRNGGQPAHESGTDPSGSSAVQIDDVNPGGPMRHVPCDEGLRVTGPQADASEVALLEADGFLSEQVDGGDDGELARMASGLGPALLLLLRCHVNMLTWQSERRRTWQMATEQSHRWSSAEIRDLLGTVLTLEDMEEAERFFRDLCTLSELEAMAHRWQVAKLVDQGLPYHEVSRRTGASTTTVTRVAHWLRHGEDGYRLALDRRRASSESA
jgi:TrpR-related protein YerC/YecD